MPIYEYECQACSRRTEVLQGINDEPRRECEECGGELKRLISAPAVQFKGTGWYVTDYAGRKDGDSKGSKEGSEKGDSKASEGAKATASSGTADSAGASE